MGITVKSFNTITSATTTSAIGIDSNPATNGRDEIAVQVEITGTATVAIQARLSDTLSWVSVQTSITANGIYRIGMCDAVRLSCTAYTSGNVTGAVLY
jgi:hypothetical protein